MKWRLGPAEDSQIVPLVVKLRFKLRQRVYRSVLTTSVPRFEAKLIKTGDGNREETLAYHVITSDGDL